MKTPENLQLFLKNYLITKNISWLDLFIVEFYRHKERSRELLSGNDKFMTLPFHMSHHLLKLLFSTICELMTKGDTEDDDNAVSTLRTLLTRGLGSGIITMMSADLDLSNVSNERELANVLTKIFPTESWEADRSQKFLDPLSRLDIKNSFKKLWLLNPLETPKTPETRTKVIFTIEDCDAYEISGKIEDFPTDEHPKSLHLSSSQLAQKIITILSKLVQVEDTTVLSQTDQNSVTLCCLNFSLDMLSHLHNCEMFNDNDQTVIKLNLLELTFLCFNNLVHRDGKSIEPVFKKLFHLLEICEEPEIACGLILNIVTILSNLCVKESIQKTENLNLFLLCHHLILKRLEILGSTDRELLHIIHLQLIRIVKFVRQARGLRKCDKKKPRKKVIDLSLHHDENSDACVFERLLIDSFPFIKSFSNLEKILNYFRARGICCCNATVASVKIFMQPSLIPASYLGFVRDEILQPMLGRQRICAMCSEKIASGMFRDEFFLILRHELEIRQGWELHILLHHLISIQKLFPPDFLEKFVFNVILPTFEREKLKFFDDPEENFESKLITSVCLGILNESVKDEKFFTLELIKNLRDCSLIPAMSGNACQLMKTAILTVKDENFVKSAENILFANALFLTRELIDIYTRLDLPRNVPLTPDRDPEQSGGDFEILDEQTVAVKEALSDLDVLLLNTIHWNILCDLIATNEIFQNDFVVNIYNNFSGNILFTVAYNALNSILLRKELKPSKIPQNPPAPDPPTVLPRHEFLTPIFTKNSYDLNYTKIMEQSHHLYEISRSFLTDLRHRETTLIYRLPRDNETKFLTSIHKDVFLPEKIDDTGAMRQNEIADDEQHWLNHFFAGFFETEIAIRDKVTKFLSRFIGIEKDLRAIHRVNTINEITNRCGIKYLSSIARNCFDICWRLSDNISFSAKMSTALEELKLLLLQDNWDDHQEAMVDALQLLLGVAEMKTTSVSRMLLMDPESHLTCSSESMFSDFGSSQDRIAFDDDDESSTDKRTETFQSLDESYDGDEEYFSTFGEADCSQSFRANSLPATLGFRNTNEHICKLVVEILMELSRKCIEKPDVWQPKVLMSLAQRLTCVRNFLGGSEFLLRGFAPILHVKDVGFEALQRTVLTLVEDLNTPNSFKAFTSVLTEKNVAVESMIERLEMLVNNEASPQPFLKVTYPTVSHEVTVNSTCDSHLHRLIQSFREVHLSNKLLTPFTESSQIFPLNFLEFKPWSSTGFSVSIWIDIEVTRESEKSSLHLVSVGSEKLMLAIYLNSDGTFSLTVMKPNQNFSKSTKATKLLHGTSNKENVNKLNIFGLGLAALRQPDQPNIRTRGFKKPKEDENENRMLTSKISMISKRSRVKSGQWMHVCFSTRSNDNQIFLLVTTNGIEQELFEIPIDGMKEYDLHDKLQVLCVGSQVAKPVNFSYSISNLMLFNSPVESPAQTSFLYSLGPDCDGLVDCEAIQLLALQGLVDMSKISTSKPWTNCGSEKLAEKLRSSVIVVCSAGKNVGYMSPDYGSPMAAFDLGVIPQPTAIPSLARSIYFSGGLSTLLFLFARTVELTDDPHIQSTSLYIFLKMSFSNNHLYAEFEQKNLFNLVAHVFKHRKCYRGPGMLKAILDVIYGGTMFSKKSRSDKYQIDERSELSIRNPKLLLKLFENFNIFSSQVEVFELLFKSLITVVRDNHPNKAGNQQTLEDNDFFDALHDFCKIHLVNSVHSIVITPPTAQIIVQLMKMHPPTLQEIQRLLLLMHHPSESFVTHDRSKFNFILPLTKPLKQSKLNISMKNSKIFNFNIKIRSTSTAPKSPSPPPTPKTPSDSTSLSQDMSASNKSLKNATVPQSPARKIVARKFDELTEEQSTNVIQALTDSKIRQQAMRTPKKMRIRRLKYQAKGSPYKKSEKSSKKEEIEMSQEDEQLVETIKSLMTTGSATSLLSDVDFDRYDKGISVLQENLFLMLRDSVMLLDDVRAETELPDVIKMETLVMFANHHDGDVRAGIINLIHAICLRQQTEKYEKMNFWIHLGNQLAISRVNMKMIQACVDWICASKICMQDLSRAVEIKIRYKPAFVLLIAMLPSMIHNHQLTASTSRFLRMILETQSDSFSTTMLNRLMTAAIKALGKLDPSQEKSREALLMLLEQIASNSLVSSGSIQPLWDLLYSLTYVERQKRVEFIREGHLSILKQLISLCIVEQNRRNSQPQMIVTQNLGNLPATEIKTRFNLIHDRAIQFVMSWSKDDELIDCEIEFVKFLIDLHFNGIYQGSSVILYSLAGNEELKSYVIRKLISCLAIDSNFSIHGNDSKLIKSLLIQYTNKNPSQDPDIIQTLTKFCGGTSPNQQPQTWNWSVSAEDKIEQVKVAAQRDQAANVEKVVYKMEPLVQTIIDSAMKLTRDVINTQNKERRNLMNEMKKSQEIDFYREWHEMIQRMIHEGGPWHNQQLCPTTWELDETEGPGRMRIRLKRKVLKIEERFFMDEFKKKAEFQHRKPLLDFILHPKETERYSIRDPIVGTFNATQRIREYEIEGEIIITEKQIIFLANQETYTNSIICDIKDITEIWDRRYMHREVALEIFLITKETFFIIYESKYERDIVKEFVCERIEKRRKSEEVTQKWIEGRVTNFDYLIELNKVGGRSYNDLMQYPVFPWILSDYESDFLNLRHNGCFRRLEKTISTQEQEKEKTFIDNYNYLAVTLAEIRTILKPYHYSSHYSNSGSILHFLVRLPPFTSHFLNYQDQNFDIPDRTFHSLATTYRLSSKESTTDVKELIPEFFFMFDFLENLEGFNFGRRQSGDIVDEVKLPPWCEGSARIFMLIHRQALESEIVKKNLHNWIDLIFGYKQRGPAAVSAINVFHPATYHDFPITTVIDSVERPAYETMIRTYGQMPKQIFTNPHKKCANVPETPTEPWPVLPTVKGLRWGAYAGSPQSSKPRKIDSVKYVTPISRLVLVEDANMIYLLPDKCHMMRAAKSDNHDLVLWSGIDSIVRIKSVQNSDEPSKKLFKIPTSDPCTACGSDVQYSNLWFGHTSGNISVYVRVDDKPLVKKKQKKSFNEALESIIGIKENGSSANGDVEEAPTTVRWNFPIILVKHQSEILDIKVCVQFKIVVSICADGRAVIWDAQKIEYVRTIEPSCNTLRSQLTHVEVSPTLGDILTVFSPRDGFDVEMAEESFEVTDSEDFINVAMAIPGKSQLRLHTINAKYIKHTFTDGIATAVGFSFVKEGTGVNVIAVGFESGTIRMYSTWTLEMVREIATDLDSPISQIVFTTYQHLAFLCNQQIQVWESEGLAGMPPKLNHIVPYC